MVSEDGQAILSVIPGISLSQDGTVKHAFIQLINGRTAQTYYFEFPIEDFYFSKRDFAIKVGENYFSENAISLNLSDSSITVKGKINMGDITPYTYKKRKPAIMGWYRFVPFMECYHGVVSLTHSVNGAIHINEESFMFNNGKGYIEKDWGESMPEAWIWIQSNHFEDSNSSFMLSIANIPWLGKSFTGFLGFLYHAGVVYRFATYTAAQLELQKISDQELFIQIFEKDFALIVRAKNNKSGMLKAPKNGSMDRRIAESIDASLFISLIDKNGEMIAKDSTTIAGLEVVGDMRKLIGIIK
jgi:hypothetical protein